MQEFEDVTVTLSLIVMRCRAARSALIALRSSKRPAVLLPRRFASTEEQKLLEEAKAYRLDEPEEFENRENPQLGDHPRVPEITSQIRPPLGWWDVQGRRKFGEDVCDYPNLSIDIV